MNSDTPTICSVASTKVLRPAGIRLPGLVLSALWLLTILTADVRGDELLLDQSSIAVKRGGDFTLSVSSDAFFQNDVFYLANLDATNVEVSAGQLWTHFKSHGIDSLDRLILFMDVNPNSLAKGPIELENLQVIIEDPDRPGTVLTQASLDRDDPTNRIVWKSTAGRKTVARVELDLGYDFMSRFSSGSEQKLVVHLTTNDGSMPITKVGIAGESDIPLVSRALMLVLFVAFWAGVFAIMYRMTIPGNQSHREASLPSSPRDGVASPPMAPDTEPAVNGKTPSALDDPMDDHSHRRPSRDRTMGPVMPQLPPTDPAVHRDASPTDVDAGGPH